MNTDKQVSALRGDSIDSTGFDIVRPAMIRLVVREHALREGIENPYGLAMATGLPYETCRRIWHEKSSRIDLATIERLCDVLRLRPGQLFDYESEPDKPKKKRRSKS